MGEQRRFRIGHLSLDAVQGGEVRVVERRMQRPHAVRPLGMPDRRRVIEEGGVMEEKGGHGTARGWRMDICRTRARRQSWTVMLLRMPNIGCPSRVNFNPLIDKGLSLLHQFQSLK